MAICNSAEAECSYYVTNVFMFRFPQTEIINIKYGKNKFQMILGRIVELEKSIGIITNHSRYHTHWPT